jgi:hypothetical protein
MEYLKNKFNELISFLKYLYLVFVLFLTFFSLIELKTLYSIDIFKFIDTPIDNFYYDLKGEVYGLC